MDSKTNLFVFKCFVLIVFACHFWMKCAWDVYTPLRRIFAVPFDMELDRNSIASIYSEGYSRVPVFERLPVSEQ
jgi:hypothetical protein